MKKNELSLLNITLVPYEEKYFDFVYSCYQDYDSRFLFTNDFVIISRNEFWDYIDRRIAKDFSHFMIVIDNLTNLAIGFIYTYNYNRQNNHIYFSIYIKSENRKGTVVATAGMIFFNYIFKYNPIRKIYCSIYDYNTVSRKVLNNAGFKLEGIQKEYKYYNGKYHDMNIYSLFREDFENLKQKLIR